MMNFIVFEGRSQTMNTKQVDGKNQASQPILLAVTGMSPAVLTETVWALSRENPAVIPARVITITTSRGKELLEQELFHGLKASDRLWSSLRKAILGRGWENDPRLNFESPRLITVPNIRTGRSDGLDDFRTSADNVAAADFLLEQVRGLAETP